MRITMLSFPGETSNWDHNRIWIGVSFVLLVETLFCREQILVVYCSPWFQPSPIKHQYIEGKGPSNWSQNLSLSSKSSWQGVKTNPKECQNHNFLQKMGNKRVYCTVNQTSFQSVEPNISYRSLNIWVFPKNKGTPKWMDGKPYEQMDDLGVPLFLETPILLEPLPNSMPFHVTMRSTMDQHWPHHRWEPPWSLER